MGSLASVVEKQYYMNCSIENLLGHSNDLTQGSSTAGDGEWDQMAGFTSVSQTETDPFGVPNNASLLTGGGSNALVLRQDFLPEAALDNEDLLTISCWIKRVSGTKSISFDIGDGDTPGMEPWEPPTDNEWYFFWYMLGAGASDWLDINFIESTGDTSYALSRFNINKGPTPFIYTETTTAIQARGYSQRWVAQSDFWRLGNNEV